MIEKQWIIIKYEDNYGDEFDFIGHEFIEKEDYELKHQIIKNYMELQEKHDSEEEHDFWGDFEMILSFGTNESITLTPDDILDDEQGFFVGKEISNSEKDVIVKYVGEWSGVNSFFQLAIQFVIEDEMFEDIEIVGDSIELPISFYESVNKRLIELLEN